MAATTSLASLAIVLLLVSSLQSSVLLQVRWLNIMDSVILIIILIALVEASFKHVDIFNEFIEGVKAGSKLLITLFPDVYKRQI